MSQPAAARPTGAAAWIVLAAGVSAALHVGKLPPAIGAMTCLGAFQPSCSQISWPNVLLPSA